MVIDLIGIYGLKGPYCTLTTTNWFLQALSVIPRGSWGDVSRRSYHDPLGKSGIVIPEPQCHGDGDEANVHPLDPARWAGPSPSLSLLNVDLGFITQHSLNPKPSVRRPPSSPHSRRLRLAPPPPPPRFAGIRSGQLDEENPSALISSGLLVQADEGVSLPVVDLIDEIPDGHFSQGGGDDHFDKNLEFNARTEHGGRKEQEITTDRRDGSYHDSIPLVPTDGVRNIANDEQLDTGSHEPTKIVSAQDIQMNADPASVDEYCQLLITSARNTVSAQLTIFEDWTHFHQEVRLKDISSFDSTVNIEEQLLEWGETEEIIEELRIIAAAHRHYRELVGLPFITPAFSESDSLPKPFPALELDSLAGDGQDTAQTKGHQIEQLGDDDTTMTSYEHQAQETEPISQLDEPQNKGNEHQALAEPRSAPRIAQNLEDHSAITPPAKIFSDHQDPESSNLQLSLDVLSTRVSSFDLSFARIRDDTNITKHHTTKLCDELKSTADGFDIKIDVLERTLTQRMVDELAVVKSQLAAIVEDLKDTGVAKRGKVVDQVLDQEREKRRRAEWRTRRIKLTRWKRKRKK
ncbi:hypothetical protein F511_00167 [Dorcoceras hygrometricum]|nr:hypothetical protein F511_00167 [Dorcoceras hygrometricum]